MNLMSGAKTGLSSVVTGLVQAFNIFFTAFHMKWFSPIITILIILGGISGVATWIIGPTKGLFVAAMDGNAPAFLAPAARPDSIDIFVGCVA